MGISLLPPDINKSIRGFSVEGNSIRFGLLAIKNIGRTTIDALVKEREANGAFSALTEFISRMESKDLNKRSMESLIKAGAFDSMGGLRIQYMIVYKTILTSISNTKKHNYAGQMNLFEMDDTPLYSDDLPVMEDYTIKEKLAYEKEVLGVYVSGHPLTQYEKLLAQHVTHNSTDFFHESDTPLPDNTEVVYGGIISSKSVKYTRVAGKAMCILAVEDLFGTVEVLVFAQLYEKFSGRLAVDDVVVVSGRVSAREDEDAKIIANSIVFFEDLPFYELWLKITDNNTRVDQITDIMSRYEGLIPVYIYDEPRNQRFKAVNVNVDLSDQLMSELSDCLGEANVKVRRVSAGVKQAL
jgi:DNA polymerase-3 subunit alpha